MRKVNQWVCTVFFVLLLFGFTSLYAQGDNNYASELKVFEDFVLKQMAIDRIPGLSIGFYKGDFTWVKGFGFADLENKLPAKASSSYRLASNTKSMTAVAVLQLAEKGKIDLDAEVQRYVPYFPRKEWPVTIRQLLGHLGGISHYRNYEVEGRIKEHKDTREAIAIFENFDLVAKPGTRYSYTSYGYNLLGAVIEGAAQQAYGDYLRENLWVPLGMEQTCMDDPNEIIPNRVKGYRLIDGEIKNSEFIDISSRFAGGGTRSTVIDLLKYARGIEEGKVLSKKSVEFMFTSMQTEDGRYIDYGSGWRITPVNGRFHVQHTGSQAETRTLLLKFPEEDLALAIAYNFEGANAGVYAQRLIQLVFNEQWNMNVYTGSDSDDALYSALLDVFNYGLSYYDRYEKPQSENPQELMAAFDYFATCINRDTLSQDLRRTERKIQAGRHPVANDAFVKVGSFMAAQLEEAYGSDVLENYHKMGAITFFENYIKYYKTSTDIENEYMFSKQFEETVTTWGDDWKSTYTDKVRQLAISPHTNMTEIGRVLKNELSDAKVYPDFLDKLTGVTRYFYENDDQQKALASAQLAVDLYPQSTSPYVFLGNTLIYFGDKEKAKEQYLKARKQHHGTGALSVNGMSRLAMDLIRSGKLEETKNLVDIGFELFPDNPRMYQTMAEIYIEKGRDLLRKAIEIDPNYNAAVERLEQIR